jgi:carboxypeptidase PM20D1
MKKSLVLLLAAVIVLVAIMSYRAMTTFEDGQVTPDPVASRSFDRQDAVRHLSEAIRIPTVSHDDRSNFDAAAFRAFHDFLKTAYPLAHQRLERTAVNDYSLVFHWPGTDPGRAPILLMGHFDVVPVDPADEEKWSYDPFSGDVADGAIWGRGSMDDKLGVIALMEAVEHLLSAGFEPRRSIYLAFGHDEEVGGLEGAKAVARRFEKLGIEFDFVLDEGGVVTEGTFREIDAPVAVIGVAEKGWVNLELTVRSTGGHSSQPPRNTAVGILARAIVALEDNPFPATLDHTRLTIEPVAFAAPFGLRFLFANTGLLEPLMLSQMIKDPGMAAGLRTTTAATMISGSPKSNILPTQARAVVNFRIIPGETAQSVMERARSVIDDERVEIAMGTHWDPSPMSPVDTEPYRLLAATIRGIDPDILVAPYVVRGGTDARYFHGVSDNVYRFFMVRVNERTIEQIHGIDEHVEIDNYLDAIRFYQALIERAANG